MTNFCTHDRLPARVLVTGASGNTGSALLRELSASGIQPVAAVSSEAARSHIPDGCEIRLFKYGNTSQIAAALEAIDTVYLLIPFNEKMVDWGAHFVQQAREQGVRFILRLSGLAAAPDSSSRMGQLHGRIDRFVKDSGIPWCILRCNSFMQNFSGHYRGMIRHGVLSLPEGNARSAYIDTGDIAAVASQIINNPVPHMGRVYDLGGPEILSNKQAVEIISAVIGAVVRYRPISDVEAREAYHTMGISSWRREVFESLSRFIREGHAGQLTDATEKLLGRKPACFKDFAERHRQCWAD